jgi:hypothetical protein
MTARIQSSFELIMGVHFTGEFYMNVYDIDLYFNVETELIKEQNIALDRIKYFLHKCLEHSIACHSGETQAIENYINANMKVCTLPEEPYDQIMGIMLTEKLNAITEGRLVISDISIGSKMSDGVICCHSLEDNIGPFIEKGWWNDNSTKINNHIPIGKGKKVVKLNKPTLEWSDVFLDWETKDPYLKNASSSEIVFAQFDNKTDK